MMINILNTYEQFNKKEFILDKKISDYFTIGIEIELASTEPIEEEPVIDDVESILSHIKEKTKLDLIRSEKEVDEDFIDEIVNQIDPDDEDYTIHTLLNQRKYKGIKKEIIIAIKSASDIYLFGASNIIYLKNKLEENFPIFMEKYKDRFKYELEFEHDENSVIEISDRKYVGLVDAIETIETFFSDYEKQDFWKFDERTGIHINIGFRNRKFKWNALKGLILMNEYSPDEIFKGMEWRIGNKYTGSLLGKFLKVLDKKKYKNYIKKNIKSFSDIAEIEDFMNEFLIKLTYDFCVKDFGINITQVYRQGYIEYRYIGGKVNEELFMEKLIYFCYITYLMTSDLEEEQYHKKLKEFLYRVEGKVNEEIEIGNQLLKI